MKKQVYIKPEIQVVELESQGALLVGSTCCPSKSRHRKVEN